MEQPFALILASASPRRRELLSRMGYAFEICAPDVDEHVEGRAEDIVKTLAVRKARAAASHYARGVIIASDTLVSLDGRPLGKPADDQAAKATLRRLSGRTHQLITGVCLLAAGKREVFHMSTQVTFYPLTEAEIDEYVAMGESRGRAGAYGIEGIGVVLVQSIQGDYPNIVGLPVAETLRRLGKLLEA